MACQKGFQARGKQAAQGAQQMALQVEVAQPRVTTILADSDSVRVRSVAGLWASQAAVKKSGRKKTGEEQWRIDQKFRVWHQADDVVGQHFDSSSSVLAFTIAFIVVTQGSAGQLCASGNVLTRRIEQIVVAF